MHGMKPFPIFPNQLRMEWNRFRPFPISYVWNETVFHVSRDENAPQVEN